MADKIKHHDFIEVDYTGKLEDGTVFDTTNENTAKQHHLHSPKMKYSPVKLCVGEGQLLPGLDAQFIDKEIGKEYTVTLQPEQAFGKRDIKKIKIIPMSTFREHNTQPQPGLQIDVDGEMGIISRVSGGRVIVNFNHPLAGKTVTYSFTAKRKLTETKEQVISFLNASLRIPEENISVEVKENKATIEIPIDFPAPIADLMAKKLSEVTSVKEVEFKKKEQSKK